MRTYSTSEIAKIVDVHPNTIMKYEKWGYITPCKRTTSGYRIYTETHLDQIKLTRVALRSKLIKWYIRKEAVNIIRITVSGALKEALKQSEEYLAHIQREMSKELEVIKVINKILESEIEKEKPISLSRSGASKLLGISINVIINWERYGLLDVPRNKKNGYRVYSEKEIKLLKVIIALRKESYCNQSISEILKKLESSNGTGLEVMNNYEFLSSLPEVEKDAKQMISYITELVNKSQNINS